MVDAAASVASFFSDFAGASFFVDYKKSKENYDSTRTRRKKRANLGRSLRSTNEAEEGAKGTKERKKNGDDCNTSLRLGLECSDGVNLREFVERERLSADPLQGLILERNFAALLGTRLWFGNICGGLFDGVLDVESLVGQRLGIFNRVSDVDVVEKNILSHGPDFEADTALHEPRQSQPLHIMQRKENTYDLVEVGRVLVLEVVRVGNLAGSPWSLVFRVVDQGGGPLALEVWIGFSRSDPLTAPRCLATLGVGNSGSKPITIFFVVPFLWLLSV